MLPGFLTQKNRTKSGKTETHLRWWVSLILSMGLALGTWNPTDINFIHYVMQGDLLNGFKPFYILVIFALWIIAFKAIFQSLQWYGAFIVMAIIAAFVWGLVQYGWIDLSDWNNIGWIGTIGMGILIWLGLNASIWWKRFTGIYTTDIAEEE